MRIVEFDCADQIAPPGYGKRYVSVAGVFQAMNGAKFAQSRREHTDFFPSLVCEIVHCTLRESVTQGEQVIEFRSAFSRERGTICSKFFFVEWAAIELTQNDRLDARSL